MKKPVGLEDKFGRRVSLKSVHVQGSINGLVLSMKTEQKYVNDSGQTIEASYTFPAGWGTQLMRFSVTLNGKKLQAVALSKRNAEKKYEDAIEQGDTAVMLEKSPLGLYTASIGNLKSGEEALIELEYVQLLRFEQGRVRVTIPTVIAERYGNPEVEGHVAPHQTVQNDLTIEYPFSVSLDVLGDMAKGNISCPSHEIQIAPTEAGRHVVLKKNGWLDRDFVMLIEDLQSSSFAIASKDDDLHTVVASFCPKLSAHNPSPLCLKILVDCSGSMQGDSIEQAQEAMHELSLRLSANDMISYSKFGSEVQHTSSQLEQCTPQFLQNVLAPAIHETDADMGGTELEKSLTSTFKLSFTKAFTEGCDLLLITDGDVWGIEEIVKQARVSNHRIFAIGVGSAPAESLLRELAELTGGSCELVTPNESIAEVVLRMTERMRSSRTQSLRIEWDGEVHWQSKLPKQVFSEETLHIVAQLKSKPIKPPTLHWTSHGTDFKDVAGELAWNATDTLPRLVAGERLLTSTTEEAEEIALKYQLASTHTNLVLVHIRENEGKAGSLPVLQKIKLMNAAGLGGMGTSAQPDFGSMAVPSVWRTHRTQAAAKVDSLTLGGMDDYEIPAFLRKIPEKQFQLLRAFANDPTPENLVDEFNKIAIQTIQIPEISMHLTERYIKSKFWNSISSEVKSKMSDKLIWVCLIYWIGNEILEVNNLTRHAKRILSSEIQNFDSLYFEELIRIFKNIFPNIGPKNWA